MLRSARFSPFAVAFFIWFALWLVADQYIGFSFYRFEAGEAVHLALRLMTLLAVLALVIVRAEPRQTARWSYALLCLALLAIVELAWRLVLCDRDGEIGKVLSFVLDISTPALLGMGVVAVLAEWRLTGARLENGTNL